MSVNDERLSPGAVRWLNKTLAPQGLRVCRCHQGHPLPLDAEHFYRRGDGQFWFECIPCARVRTAAYQRQRYATDPVYRERQAGQTRQYTGTALENRRKRSRDYKRRKRAERLAAVLNKSVNSAGVVHEHHARNQRKEVR